ncbi:PKD domain-containing protein, partial [Candidatus Bipolaricaulota bacterium]|nr:PKD domain-containing protein [Candidatus Bipolaricaulota bacterium]
MRARPTILVLLMAIFAIGLSGCFQPAGPLARFTATPKFAYPPLETTLDASASSSPDGAIVSYDWDFGDGETGTGAVVTHTY